MATGFWWLFDWIIPKRKIKGYQLDKILRVCGLEKRALREKDGHVRRRIINALLEIKEESEFTVINFVGRK